MKTLSRSKSVLQTDFTTKMLRYLFQENICQWQFIMIYIQPTNLNRIAYLTVLLCIEWLRMRERACMAPRPTAESLLTRRIISPTCGSPVREIAPPGRIERIISPSPSLSGLTVTPEIKKYFIKHKSFFF